MFEWYSLVLFVHVVAAVALVGHSLTTPISRAVLREARTVRDVGRLAAFEHRLSRWNPAIALVLLASGVYLGSAGWWWQGWFYVSIAAWLVNSALAARIVGPGVAALAAAADAAGDGPVPPGVDALRRSTRLAVASQVMLGADIAILFIMMNKPTTLGSLAILGAVTAALVALAFLPRRQAAPVLTRA